MISSYFTQTVTRVRQYVDTFGRESQGPDYEVIRCRIENTTKAIRQMNGEWMQLKMRIFMDPAADIVQSDYIVIGAIATGEDVKKWPVIAIDDAFGFAQSHKEVMI